MEEASGVVGAAVPLRRDDLAGPALCGTSGMSCTAPFIKEKKVSMSISSMDARAPPESTAR